MSHCLRPIWTENINVMYFCCISLHWVSFGDLMFYLLISYRLLLAALHFNNNGNRDVARTSEGEARYAVRYPRFRKGGWVVRPIKEKPSYG